MAASGALPGAEGRATAIAETPDLVLMDLPLPNTIGLELTTEFRSRADTVNRMQAMQSNPIENEGDKIN